MKTGGPDNSIKNQHIKFLKDIGWIRIANNTAKRNQGIYILGVWEEIKDAKGKVYKKETMFDEVFTPLSNIVSNCFIWPIW